MTMMAQKGKTKLTMSAYTLMLWCCKSGIIGHRCHDHIKTKEPTTDGKQELQDKSRVF